MKLSFKLITILIAISIVSCKNTNNQNESYKTDPNNSNKVEANEIVEYNNILVSLTDQNNQYLKKLNENLNLISIGLENPHNQFDFTGIIPPLENTTASLSKPTPDTPPITLNNSDQIYFKENVFGLTATLVKIKETYNSLDNYIKAEDFKDDKGNMGKLLIDSIYSMCEKYYIYDEKILNKLKNIGDDAERIVLKSHPLKDYIFALKDDRKAVADFNKLIGEGENYKLIASKVESAYQVLLAQNKKHTAMVAPDAKKYPGRDRSFKSFNNCFNEYLIEARKVMKTAALRGKISESDLDNLLRKQDDMRGTYNSFVN